MVRVRTSLRTADLEAIYTMYEHGTSQIDNRIKYSEVVTYPPSNNLETRYII